MAKQINARGGDGDALPFPHGDMTFVEAQAQADRFGLLIITDGESFDYALPGQVRQGWRALRRIHEPRLEGEATHANDHARSL